MSFLTQNFSVRNDLNLNSLRISGDLTLGGDLASNANPNNFTRAGQGYNLLVGYTPAEFSLGTDPSVLFNLNTVAGASRDVAVDGAGGVAVANSAATTLILPARHAVVRAWSVNTSAVLATGTTTISCGVFGGGTDAAAIFAATAVGVWDPTTAGTGGYNTMLAAAASQFATAAAEQINTGGGPPCLNEDNLVTITCDSAQTAPGSSLKIILETVDLGFSGT